MARQASSVNISTLQGATGISSSDLFDFHPDSSPPKVLMSHFFIAGINTTFEDLEYSTDGGSTWTPSSNLENENLGGGDRFRVGVVASDNTLHPDGDHTTPSLQTSGGELIVVEAFVKQSDVFLIDEDQVARKNIFTDDDTSFSPLPDNGDDVLVFEYEIDSGANSVLISGAWEDGGYNDDVSGYNTLFKRDFGVGGLDIQVTQNIDTDNDEITLDWSIFGGISDYFFTIDRDGNQIFSTTYTQNTPISDSYTDTNPNNAPSTYTLEVNDGNNDVVSETINSGLPS